MIPPELMIVLIRLYEISISKLKTNEGWFKDSKCNIKFKQGCRLFPSLFGIYIDKIQECLEIVGCKGMDVTGIIITLLIYDDDAIILARRHDELDKHLKNPHVYSSNMDMTINIDKTNVMVIKSKKITHGSFVYDNHRFEQVSSYKCLDIDFSYQLNQNYSIKKRIIGGWKAYYELKNNCKSIDLYIWSKKMFLFKTLVTPVILYIREVFGCSICGESWRNNDMIQKKFITHNLKVKGNTPYLILLI